MMARSFLEQAQSFPQVSFLDDKQRREQLYVVTGKFRGVFRVTTASADVGELTDDFGSGGRQDRSGRPCARHAERVAVAELPCGAPA